MSFFSFSMLSYLALLRADADSDTTCKPDLFEEGEFLSLNRMNVVPTYVPRLLRFCPLSNLVLLLNERHGIRFLTQVLILILYIHVANVHRALLVW